MFWTCDATCKVNKQEYEQRRRIYDDINRGYLKGVAEVHIRRYHVCSTYQYLCMLVVLYQVCFFMSVVVGFV